MSWFLLVLAGLFEIGWAIGLKYTDGFTRLWPSIFTVASMAVSVLLLGLAVKQLPIGTAYGVWVGIGAMGTAIAGIILLGEGVSLLKIASLILILLLIQTVLYGYITELPKKLKKLLQMVGLKKV